MRKNQSSLTAAGTAIVRAIESEKPAGERICYDPYARRFTGNLAVNRTRTVVREEQAVFGGKR